MKNFDKLVPMKKKSGQLPGIGVFRKKDLWSNDAKFTQEQA